MRTNFAPTSETIIVALILMIVGLIGTYGSTPIPDQVGVLAFVVSGALLLLGVVTRRSEEPRFLTPDPSYRASSPGAVSILAAPAPTPPLAPLRAMIRRGTARRSRRFGPATTRASMSSTRHTSTTPAAGCTRRHSSGSTRSS